MVLVLIHVEHEFRHIGAVEELPRSSGTRRQQSNEHMVPEVIRATVRVLERVNNERLTLRCAGVRVLNAGPLLPGNDRATALRKSCPARHGVIATQEQSRCEDGEHLPMIIRASSPAGLALPQRCPQPSERPRPRREPRRHSRPLHRPGGCNVCIASALLSREAGERTRSVVIAGLKELESIFRHNVYQPMLLGQGAWTRLRQPNTSAGRLPNSREWVSNVTR